MKFHGFPLNEDQHPQLPQWRIAPDLDPAPAIGTCWRRVDGKTAIPTPDWMAETGEIIPDTGNLDLLAEENRDPIVRPDVLPGQTRLTPDGHVVLVGTDNYCTIIHKGDMGQHVEYVLADPAWPLLWGPAVLRLKDRELHFSNLQCR